MRVCVGYVCPSHGYIRGSHCLRCNATTAKSDSIGIITNDWVTKETWSDIDPANPNLRVGSKRELLEVCERTGNYARAFMKPKSQGKGWEHKKRGA